MGPEAFTSIDVPANATLEQLVPYAEQVNQIFQSEPEFDHSFQITFPNGGFWGVGLKPWNERTRTAQKIQPELQGRLPIRVELQALSRDDFRRILTEPEASLIKQYVALMATEGVNLEFSEDAIDAVADVAVAVNSSVENIGARRLQTVMERVLDDISFGAPDRAGETVKIDAAYVHKHVGDLAKNADLSRFIL